MIRSFWLLTAALFLLGACASPLATAPTPDPTLAAAQALELRQQADALRLENRFNEAAGLYRQALALTPNDAETHAGLGAALLGLGQNEEALVVLRRATELDMRHYWAYRLMGSAYLNLERWAAAADALTQAYVLDPSDPNLLVGIAVGQGRSDQRELALHTLDRLEAVTTDPRLLADAATLRQEFSAAP